VARLPRVRRSFAAKTSSCCRSSSVTRRLICAFHSPTCITLEVVGADVLVVAVHDLAVLDGSGDDAGFVGREVEREVRAVLKINDDVDPPILITVRHVIDPLTPDFFIAPPPFVLSFLDAYVESPPFDSANPCHQCPP